MGAAAGDTAGALVFGGAVTGGAVARAAASTLLLRDAPQRGQKAKSGSHPKPHDGHGAGSFRPQRGQKAKSGGASY